MTQIGHIGEKLDLVIKQGSTLGPFRVTLSNPDQTPVDLTGVTIRAQIRKRALDPVVVEQLSVSITAPLDGRFEFGLSSNETAAMVAGESLKDAASVYVWDMELEDAAGRITPLYFGSCHVFREVTRA